MLSDTLSTIQVNTLFDESDVTVEQILSCPNIVDECKAHNKKVLNFLTQSECLKKLLYVVISSPVSSVPLDLQFQNASIASEILSSGIPYIRDALVDDPECLRILYDAVYCHNSMSSLTISLINKILSSLIQDCSAKLLQFFMSMDNLTDHIVSGIQNPIIMEPVCQLLSSSETSDSCLDMAAKFLKEGLVEKLLMVFHLDQEDEIHSSLIQALSKLVFICRSRDHMNALFHFQTRRTLLDQLESPNTLGCMMSQIFCGSDECIYSDSLLINGLVYLICLVDNCALESGPALPCLPQNICSCMWSEPIGFIVCNAICPHLNALKQRLLIDHKIPPSSEEVSIKTLAPARLYIVRFLRLLWECKCVNILDELLRLDILGDIVELFFKFPLNTLLHSSVENLIRWLVLQALLDSSLDSSAVHRSHDSNQSLIWTERSFVNTNPVTAFNSSQASKSTIIELTNINVDTSDKQPKNIYWRFLYQLICDHSLLDRIQEAWLLSSSTQNAKSSSNFGYGGHLRLISNLLTLVLGPIPQCHLDNLPNNTQLITFEFLHTVAHNGLLNNSNEYNPGLQAYLRSGIELASWDRWCEFVLNELSRVNEASYINYTEIANTLPCNDDFTNDECEFSNPVIHDVLDKAYAKYCTDPVTTIFMDQFGVPEGTDYLQAISKSHSVFDEQLAELDFSCMITEDWDNNNNFEQICNEIIQLDNEEVGRDIICGEGTTTGLSSDSAIQITSNVSSNSELIQNDFPTNHELPTLESLTQLFDKLEANLLEANQTHSVYVSSDGSLQKRDSLDEYEVPVSSHNASSQETDDSISSHCINAQVNDFSHSSSTGGVLSRSSLTDPYNHSDAASSKSLLAPTRQLTPPASPNAQTCSQPLSDFNGNQSVLGHACKPLRLELDTILNVANEGTLFTNGVSRTSIHHGPSKPFVGANGFPLKSSYYSTSDYTTSDQNSTDETIEQDLNKNHSDKVALSQLHNPSDYNGMEYQETCASPRSLNNTRTRFDLSALGTDIIRSASHSHLQAVLKHQSNIGPGDLSSGFVDLSAIRSPSPWVSDIVETKRLIMPTKRPFRVKTQQSIISTQDLTTHLRPNSKSYGVTNFPPKICTHLLELTTIPKAFSSDVTHLSHAKAISPNGIRYPAGSPEVTTQVVHTRTESLPLGSPHVPLHSTLSKTVPNTQTRFINVEPPLLTSEMEDTSNKTRFRTHRTLQLRSGTDHQTEDT